MKKPLFWLKLLLSVIVLALLFRGIDFKLAINTVTTGNISLFVAAFLLICATNVVQVVRWRYLTNSRADRAGETPDLPLDKREQPGFLVFLRYHLIANFFQLFLPSSASGDVVKAYFSVRNKNLGATSLASIVIGRLLGVVAVLGIGLGVVLTLPDHTMRQRILSDRMMWVIAAGVLLACIVVLNANRYKVASIWPNAPRLIQRILGLSERILTSLGQFRNRPGLLAGGLLLSAAIHVLMVGTSYLIFVGLGWNVSLAVFAVYIPIISLLTMVPVSFNGMGIREALFSYFLGPFGCTPELVLSYAVVGYASLFIVGIAGWVCYMFNPAESKNFSQAARTDTPKESA